MLTKVFELKKRHLLPMFRTSTHPLCRPNKLLSAEMPIHRLGNAMHSLFVLQFLVNVRRRYITTWHNSEAMVRFPTRVTHRR